MAMELRDDAGKFAPKSDSERKVRSIRATDRTWNDFGFEADKRRITRADLLEQWVRGESLVHTQIATPIELGLAMAILNDALDLKANAGGAIKAKIREALETLQPGN
jgi:hypothetical protein